jgi:hypothetical protein
MLMDLLISSIAFIHLSIQVSKLDQFVEHDKFGIAFEYILSIQLNFLVFGKHLTSMKTGGIFMPLLFWSGRDTSPYTYLLFRSRRCPMPTCMCKM